MRTKASVVILLILSAALLTGCNYYGTDRKTVQVTGKDMKAAVDEQDITSKTPAARLQEDLRLANERARLAEERAELEKQKRQLAEERLKQPAQKDRDDNGEEATDGEQTGGS